MLMLEVAPHVLRPVKPLYRYADRIAHRYRHNHHFGKAVWALGQTPRSAGRALVTLWRSLGHAWRLLTAGHAHALPEGPRSRSASSAPTTRPPSSRRWTSAAT